MEDDAIQRLPKEDTTPQDETSPLLHRIESRKPSLRETVQVEKPWRLVVGACVLILLIEDLGASMTVAALLKIFEEVSCAKYWEIVDPGKIQPDGRVLERDCKIAAVQSLVALINSWQGVWNSIPGLILAVPLGVLADRWGRKKVLALSLLGLWLSGVWIALVCYVRAPLQWTWTSAVFLLIGGGPVVTGAMLMTMVGDVVPEDMRTASFSWMFAALLSSEMVGPALASWIMRTAPWNAVLVGLCIQVSMFLILVVLPETLKYAPKKIQETNVRGTSMSFSNVRGLFARQWHGVHKTVTQILKDRNLALLLFTSFFLTLGPGVMATLFYQYISNRYGWIYADAVLLGTLRSAVNLVLYIFILPPLPIMIAKKFNISATQANLQICYVTSVLLSISLLIIGASPNVWFTVFGIVVYVLGTGFLSTIRSIGASIVENKKTQVFPLARLFTMMGIMQAFGNIFVGTLVPLIFSRGMDMGGAWIGLPFLFAAGLYAVMAVATMFIRVPESPNTEEDA